MRSQRTRHSAGKTCSQSLAAPGRWPRTLSASRSLSRSLITTCPFQLRSYYATTPDDRPTIGGFYPRSGHFAGSDPSSADQLQTVARAPVRGTWPQDRHTTPQRRTLPYESNKHDHVFHRLCPEDMALVDKTGNQLFLD